MRTPRWRVGPQRVDHIVAAILGVLWLVQVAAVGDQLRPDRWVAGAAGLVVCVGVALRRRWPFAVAAGTQLIMEVIFRVGHLPPGPVTIAWFCALYAGAVWASTRRFLVVVALFALPQLYPWPPAGSLGLFSLAGAAVLALVRVTVTGRDRRLEVARAERDVAAREAVVEERARIARELHDVVSHHISAMVVQAGAERHVLGFEHEQTTQVLATIEDVGRSALTEMRRMVSMLRDDPNGRLTPQPVLADVPLLVDQVRSAGVPVEYAVDGDVRDLPLGIELSGYRIIQEALTNTIKHAGNARARVHVTYHRDVLEIEATDDGRAPGPPTGGHGLVGMRERVEVYGGTLEAGYDGTGFRVVVRLPVR